MLQARRTAGADGMQVHVDKVEESNSDFATSTEAAKLMHRMREDEVEKLMDGVMKS